MIINIEIRKGKTEIVKKDFTLILGWNPTIFKIISELVISNTNHENQNNISIHIKLYNCEKIFSIKFEKIKILKNMEISIYY